MSGSRRWTGRFSGTKSPITKTLVARERSEERRAAFLNDLAPYLNEPQRLVFVDESGFNTAMTRSYARAPSHLRAVDGVPRNHGRNDTLVCAVSLVGPLAPLVLDGPMTALVFEWYVREHLCPTLVKGQVVVMDNLSSHRRPVIRTLIEAAGCILLYLLSYSPDFNPHRAVLFQTQGPGARQCLAHHRHPR
jgi:DDE superfamily endonuclease